MPNKYISKEADEALKEMQKEIGSWINCEIDLSTTIMYLYKYWQGCFP
jgi:hypothetical protein